MSGKVSYQGITYREVRQKLEYLAEVSYWQNILEHHKNNKILSFSKTATSR